MTKINTFNHATWLTSKHTHREGGRGRESACQPDRKLSWTLTKTGAQINWSSLQQCEMNLMEDRQRQQNELMRTEGARGQQGTRNADDDKCVLWQGLRGVCVSWPFWLIDDASGVVIHVERRTICFPVLLAPKGETIKRQTVFHLFKPGLCCVLEGRICEAVRNSLSYAYAYVLPRQPDTHTLTHSHSHTYTYTIWGRQSQVGLGQGRSKIEELNSHATPYGRSQRQ